MTMTLARRNFLLTGCSAALWPFAARAQQAAQPLIGFLSTRAPTDSAGLIAAYRQGLKEAGYVEGRNITIEYRWAEGHYDRLPSLVAGLIDRRVDLIFSPGQPAVLAAKAATTTIPIVFTTGDDPVKTGLVASFNHPGGNVTGVNLFASQLGAKRLGLLRELAPKAAVVAVLVNPSYSLTDFLIKDVESAASAIGLQVRIFNAAKDEDFEPAFSKIAQLHPDALMVGADPFFTGRSARLVGLAARLAIPAIYEFREFPAAGGLMSYGTSLADTYHQCAILTGRILKGKKPVDLPVMQSSKFEFVINVKTAQTLGLSVPPTMLATADEVIE